MSYTSTTVPNLEPNEHAFTLDTGETVAAIATVNRDPIHSELSCLVTIRQVSPTDGSTVTDAHGNPITSTHTHSTTVQYLSLIGGVQGLVRQTLEIALGEDGAIAVVNDHIRNAISAASISTQGYDLTSLGQ